MKNSHPLKSILLVSSTFLLLSSCSSVFSSFYGIKSIKPLSEKKIIKFCDKYNIPIEDSFELDTAYFSYLFSLDTIKYASQIKNHYQPLQALYYGADGQLKSFQMNCYAGGFPNITWNRDSIFEVFIPKMQAPLDSILPLEKQLEFLLPLSMTKNESYNDFDYVVVVHWNRFMGRQSKRLIEIVQKNAKLAGNAKVKIVYVNSDNIFAGND